MVRLLYMTFFASCYIFEEGLSSPPQARAITPDPNTILCRRCINAQTLADCSNVERCDRQTEMCYMDQIITDSADFVFNGGCRARQMCQHVSVGTAVGRRRGLISCTRCCEFDNECNTLLCSIPKGPSPISG